MRKGIYIPGQLLRKTRRQDKGKVFTIESVVGTNVGPVYVLKCYKTGKIKALRHSSLSEYKVVYK